MDDQPPPVQPPQWQPPRRIPVPAEVRMRQIEAAVSLALSLALLDMMTGGQVKQALRTFASEFRRTWAKPALVVPAWQVSALHQEARRITEEAAHGEHRP